MNSPSRTQRGRVTGQCLPFASTTSPNTSLVVALKRVRYLAQVLPAGDGQPWVPKAPAFNERYR